MENKGIGIRAVSVIIDTIIGFVFFMIAGFAYTGSLNFQVFGADAMTLGGAWSVLFFLYFFLLEGYKGQTIGKMVTGIKVVKDDGSPCDMMASFIRNILRIIDGMFIYIVGAVIIAVTDKNQRLGDLAGKTVVVDA
ncbi:MAG: RDD family protein [Candidatus Aenigmatarchaeota archaeon]